jgi:hypothetical protein
MIKNKKHGGKRKGAGTKFLFVENPGIKDIIIKAIKLGATYKDACAYARIDYRNLYNWIQIAKTELKSGKRIKKRYEDVVDFYLDLKVAQADGKIYCLEEIKNAGKKDWKALAWLAARVYGYTEKTVIEGGDKPIQIEDKSKMIDDLLNKFPDKDIPENEK